MALKNSVTSSISVGYKITARMYLSYVREVRQPLKDAARSSVTRSISTVMNGCCRPASAAGAGADTSPSPRAFCPCSSVGAIRDARAHLERRTNVKVGGGGRLLDALQRQLEQFLHAPRTFRVCGRGRRACATTQARARRSALGDVTRASRPPRAREGRARGRRPPGARSGNAGRPVLFSLAPRGCDTTKFI
ncbi:hypothetical protein EVAR_17260_1 [Eumeta japonica]|uniref:Uncharacterized protein n=1 Tax=Eumeta variegata TaxID=151549 RepID=A0A4C1TSZ0_EUMVA|nr:hypothetical protein EVAR_17260_1 [Eumeta japonica]